MGIIGCIGLLASANKLMVIHFPPVWLHCVYSFMHPSVHCSYILFSIRFQTKSSLFWKIIVWLHCVYSFLHPPLHCTAKLDKYQVSDCCSLMGFGGKGGMPVGGVSYILALPKKRERGGKTILTMARFRKCLILAPLPSLTTKAYQ